MRTHAELTLRPSERMPRQAGATHRTDAGAQVELAPSPRPGRGILAVSWLPAVVALAIVEIALRAPALLAQEHALLCTLFATSAAFSLLLVGVQIGRPTFPLVRRRLVLVALGTAGGLALPLVLIAYATTTGRDATLAGALVLSCFFPLASTYAARCNDLFHLDRALQRLLTYGIVVVSMALAEIAVLTSLEHTALPLLPSERMQLAAGNLLLLMLVPLLYQHVAKLIGRWLTPQRYHPRRQLARLSDALGGCQTMEGVRRAVADSLIQSVNPAQHHLYIEDKRGQLMPFPAGTASAGGPLLPKPIIDAMRRGRIAYRNRWDDGRAPATAALWTPLSAELFVPIFAGGGTQAVLALGPKRGGHHYHEEDIAFLQAAASLAALAVSNARAFTQLREMNTTLEHTIDERTAAERAANAELQGANADLARSLNELQGAYSQLEQNHACLLRADRLATLGRLTAGIAHEVNTPLSAVQNALRILRELGEEYAGSIDDASVRSTDHHDIAREIVATATSAAEWADKAARFIRGTKAHGRTARDTVAEPFAVSDMVDEARTMLVHRLRVAGCTLECEAERPGIVVLGDRSAFSQVLINLISNALDAYEDGRITDARIVVAILQPADTVTVEVRDWAGGIPLQVLPRIFEELFTTKNAGRGTGLGLWISRTIIEKEFGGSLDVMSVPGEGSRFIATLPAPTATALPAPRQDAA